jgi:CheY-like chemotaxis protein
MTTLLLVDDEKNIIELERLYLEPAGYHIEVAYDGKSARSARISRRMLSSVARSSTDG